MMKKQNVLRRRDCSECFHCCPLMSEYGLLGVLDNASVVTPNGRRDDATCEVGLQWIRHEKVKV